MAPTGAQALTTGPEVEVIEDERGTAAVNPSLWARKPSPSGSTWRWLEW